MEVRGRVEGRRDEVTSLELKLGSSAGRRVQSKLDGGEYTERRASVASGGVRVFRLSFTAAALFDSCHVPECGSKIRLVNYSGAARRAFSLSKKQILYGVIF